MVSISIKKLLYDFILGSIVFYITTQVISGIQTPNLLSHWLMIFVIFAISNTLVGQSIKFFTLPSNILTNILIGIILNFAAIYGMTLILPGISITETSINPVSLGLVSVNPFILNPTFTMLAGAIVSSFLFSTLSWLQYD